MDRSHQLSDSHLATQLLQDRHGEHNLVEMVGTKTWNDEQRAFVVDANERGMKRNDIAQLFVKRFPKAVMNKVFTGNSVKYILDEWKKIHPQNRQDTQMNNDDELIDGVGGYNVRDQQMQHLSSNQNFAPNISQMHPSLRLTNTNPFDSNFQSPVGSSMMPPAHQGFRSPEQFGQQQRGLSNLNSGFQLSNDPGIAHSADGSHTSPHMAHALGQPSTAAVNHISGAPYIQSDSLSSGAPISGSFRGRPIDEMVNFHGHVIHRGALDYFRQKIVEEGCPGHMVDVHTKQTLDKQRQMHSASANQDSNPPTSIQAHGMLGTQLQSLSVGNMGSPGMQQSAQQSNLQQNQTQSSPRLSEAPRDPAMDQVEQHFRKMEEEGITRQQYAQLVALHVDDYNRQQLLQRAVENVEQNVSRVQNDQQNFSNGFQSLANSFAKTQGTFNQMVAKRRTTFPEEKPSRPLKKRKKRVETAKTGAPSKTARTDDIKTETNDESRVMSYPPITTKQKYVVPLLTHNLRTRTVDDQVTEQDADLAFNSNQDSNTNFSRSALHMPAGIANQNDPSQGTYGFGAVTAPPLQATQPGRAFGHMHQPTAFQDSTQGQNQSYIGTGFAQRNSPNVSYPMAQISHQAGNTGSQWHGNQQQAAGQQQATQEAIRRQVWDQNTALRASQQRKYSLGGDEPRAPRQRVSPEGHQNQANGFSQHLALEAFPVDASYTGAGVFPEFRYVNPAGEDLYTDEAGQFVMGPEVHPSSSLEARKSADKDFPAGHDQSQRKHAETLIEHREVPLDFSLEGFPELKPVDDFEWSDYTNLDADTELSAAQMEELRYSNANKTEVGGKMLGKAAGNGSGKETQSPDTIASLRTPNALGSSPPCFEIPPVNSNSPSSLALLGPTKTKLPETSWTWKLKSLRVVPAEYQDTKFEKALLKEDWIPANYELSWHREAIHEFEEENSRQSDAIRESKILGDPIRQAIERRIMKRVPASDETYIPVSKSRDGFDRSVSNQSHGGSFNSATWTDVWLKNCHSEVAVQAYDAESRDSLLKADSDVNSFSHELIESSDFDSDADHQRMWDEIRGGGPL